MIVVFDAEPILGDPTLSGTAWRVLAHAAATWGVSMKVPSTVLIEVDAGYDRLAADQLKALNKWQRTQARLGHLDISAIRSTVDRLRAEFPETVRRTLTDVGVEVIDPAPVDHVTLVQRAASRRRPCDDKGDGYRDTLLWLTVLDLAARTSEDVVLVSGNTADFGDGTNPPTLHPHLREDVEQVSPSANVAWFTSVKDLVVDLARRASADAQLEDLDRNLVTTAVRDYVIGQLLPSVVGTSLPAQTAGLPLDTRSGDIRAVDPVDEATVEINATGDGEALATFTVTCDMVVELVPDVRDDDDAWGDVPETMVKQLLVTGLVELGRLGRPKSGQVDRISPLDGDPLAAAWRTVTARSNVNAAALRSVQAFVNSPAFRDAARAAQQAMRNTSVTPDLARTQLAARLGDSAAIRAAREAADSVNRFVRDNPNLQATLRQAAEILRRQAEWTAQHTTEPPQQADTTDNGNTDGETEPPAGDGDSTEQD